MSFIVPSIIANSVIEIDTKMQDIKITVIYNTCIQNEILNAIYVIWIIFCLHSSTMSYAKLLIYVTEGKRVVKIPPFTILRLADYFRIKTDVFRQIKIRD
jgi:hypothetical protein